VAITKGYQYLLFMLKETNPYNILEVDETASTEIITSSYHELAKHYHPDKFPHLKETPEYKDIEIIFQKITQAYNYLKDPKERKKKLITGLITSVL